MSDRETSDHVEAKIRQKVVPAIKEALTPIDTNLSKIRADLADVKAGLNNLSEDLKRTMKADIDRALTKARAARK